MNVHIDRMELVLLIFIEELGKVPQRYYNRVKSTNVYVLFNRL